MKDALPVSFLAQNTVDVAKALLGQLLVFQNQGTAAPLIFKVVETEAYTQTDPACHGFKGAKGRGATLYKAPGLSYVYFIYGMYHCLNVVTEPEGQAGAVLFRALEPISFPPGRQYQTHGPGRLCKALGITKAKHNEINMTETTSPFFLAPGESIGENDIVTTTRVGISIAQDYPWRFYLKENPHVSVLAKTAKENSK